VVRIIAAMGGVGVAGSTRAPCVGGVGGVRDGAVLLGNPLGQWGHQLLTCVTCVTCGRYYYLASLISSQNDEGQALGTITDKCWHGISIMDELISMCLLQSHSLKESLWRFCCPDCIAGTNRLFP